jgi:hypothetical protein
LIIKGLQRSDEGNYLCVVANKFGRPHFEDRIMYQLQVQVPPAPPILQVISTGSDTIHLKWRINDNGGSQILGFMLTYRAEFGDWEELGLDFREEHHTLENLLCGTNYQLQILATVTFFF